MYIKIVKIRRHKNAITSELMKQFPSKYDMSILMPVTLLCESFKSVSCNIFGKLCVKERHGRVGPGRVGPGHHGYRLYIEKSNCLLYEPHS